MTTIEEARKALEQIGYEEWRGYEEVMRRADAYALAVLDEAMASAPLGAAYVRDWKERRRNTLRQRIEELGK